MEDSISEWFGNLKAGDAEAAQNLWKRYALTLENLARNKLNGSAEEDRPTRKISPSVSLAAFAGELRPAALRT